MRHKSFPLSMFVLWLVSYLIYPLWYLPQEGLRGMAFWILLLFFVANFLLLNKFVCSLNRDNISIVYVSTKNEKIIWLAGIVYFLLELYPMTMPVLSRNDEEHYLTSSLLYYSKIPVAWERFLKCPVWCVWIFAILLVLIFRKKIKIIFLTRKSFPIAIVLTLSVFIYHLIFINRISVDSFFYLFHYPFFSKVFYMASYSIFGSREFGPRLVQSIFGFLSAVYLYKFVLLYRSRETALFSYILWLFMPACLFFGNLALLVNGISFFFIASFYYLLKYHRDRSSRDLLLGTIILSAGTMYQQPVVIALFIYYIYLLILLISRKISFVRDRTMIILPGWAVLVTAVPYLVITRFIYVPFGGYQFFVNELFSKTAYLEQTGLTLSGLSIVHILLLACGIIATLRKRDIFSLFIFVWFGAYFLFQIIYPYTGVFRLLVPYFPVLAIWMGEGAGMIIRKRFFKKMAVVVLLYAIVSSTVWTVPFFSTGLMLYQNIHSRYLPYPEAMLYLKENLSTGERCLSPGHSSPEKFYCMKFGMPISKIDHAWWWAGNVESQTGDNLYEYAKSNNIKFCLFPSGDWPKGFLNQVLRDRLIFGLDKRFILDKVFLSGENKLYLLEVR